MIRPKHAFYKMAWLTRKKILTKCLRLLQKCPWNGTWVKPFHSGNVHRDQNTPCSEHFLQVATSNKVHAVVMRSAFPSQNLQAHHVRTTFGSCDVEKVQAVVAGNAFPSQNLQNALKLTCRKSARRCDTNCEGYGALLDVQMSFCVAGAGDCAPCQKRAKREGFVAVAKTMAGVGHWKRIWKDAFRVAGAVQETLEVDVLRDQGGDFLRRVAFLSMKSSGLLPCFCVTGAALRMTCGFASSWQTQHFRDMDPLFLMLSTSKLEVSQNSFVFKLEDRQIDR